MTSTDIFHMKGCVGKGALSLSRICTLTAFPYRALLAVNDGGLALRRC